MVMKFDFMLLVSIHVCSIGSPEGQHAHWIVFTETLADEWFSRGYWKVGIERILRVKMISNPRFIFTGFLAHCWDHPPPCWHFRVWKDKTKKQAQFQIIQSVQTHWRAKISLITTVATEEESQSVTMQTLGAYYHLVHNQTWLLQKIFKALHTKTEQWNFHMG